MKKYICLSLIALANTCAFAQGRVNFIPEWDTNIPTNQRPSAVRGLVLSAVSRDATVGLARAADNRFYLWDLQKRRVLPTRLISYDALRMQSHSISKVDDDRWWLRGYFFKEGRPFVIVSACLEDAVSSQSPQTEVFDLEDTNRIFKMGKSYKELDDIIQHEKFDKNDNGMDVFFTNTFPCKVNKCELLPDNKTLIVCSGSDEDWNETINNLSAWDLETGQSIRVFTGAKGAIYDFALNHDASKFLAGGFDMDVHLWDIRTGKLLATLSRGKIIPKGMETTWGIGKVALTENARFAAAASGSGLVFVWDVRSQKLLGPPLQFLNAPFNNWPPELAFDPSGKHLAVAKSNKVFIYSLPNLQQVDVLKGKQAYPTKIAFLDNQTLAISSVEGSEGVITRFWTLKY